MSLPLTREVGSLASSEGEITKRDNDSSAFDSSRVLSTIYTVVSQILFSTVPLRYLSPAIKITASLYATARLPPRQRGLNRMFHVLKSPASLPQGFCYARSSRIATNRV